MQAQKKRKTKQRTAETRGIEEVLKKEFPRTSAYRYNSVSIRVRIFDERFRGKSIIDREELVLPLIQQLPEATQEDITFLLLLAPGEENGPLKYSMMNREFEDPSPSVV